MTVQCHTCGYRSSNASFFRTERAGAIGRLHQVCRGCRPYEPTKTERRLAPFVSALLIVPGMFAGVYGDQANSAQLGLVFFLAYVLGRPGLIWIHEAGHVLAAHVLGYRVLSVSLGSGPRTIAFRLRGYPVILRRYAFNGGLTRMVGLINSQRRLPLAIIYLAGALANLAFAGCMIGIIAALDGAEPSARIDGIEAIATALMLASTFMALGNLWPIKAGANDGQDSDGALLLSLLAKREPVSDALALATEATRLSLIGSHDAAARLLEDLLPKRPTDPWLLCNIVHQVMRGQGPDAALDKYDQVTVSGPAQPYFADLKLPTAYLQATLAWAMLHSGRQTDTTTIEAYALAAMEALPEAPEIKGTYGALLVRQGRLDLGEPLLIEGLRGAEDPSDRAGFCLVLAEARRAEADEEGALAYDGLRDHLLIVAAA